VKSVVSCVDVVSDSKMVILAPCKSISGRCCRSRFSTAGIGLDVLAVPDVAVADAAAVESDTCSHSMQTRRYKMELD